MNYPAFTVGDWVRHRGIKVVGRVLAVVPIGLSYEYTIQRMDGSCEYYNQNVLERLSDAEVKMLNTSIFKIGDNVIVKGSGEIIDIRVNSNLQVEYITKGSGPRESNNWNPWISEKELEKVEDIE
jgi:hypothetical protein